MKTKLPLIAVAIIVLVLALAPMVLSSSGQGILTRMLIAVLFATGYNLLLGQAGLLSFGHAAFYGAGAIATIHAMIGIESGAFYFPLLLLPVVGAATGFFTALVAGFFASKRSGTYFALVTLAMAELVHVIAPMWQTVFGGEAGLTSMRMPSLGFNFSSASEVYFLTLVWVIFGMIFLWLLSKTAFGQLTLALKGNEQRLRFLGYNVHYSKVLVFSFSGMIAGMAGSLLSISTETANYTLFSAEISTQVAFYAFIGGTAYFLGPAIAAAVLTLLPNQLSNYTHAWPLYQGLLFMVIMLATPHGIGGLFSDHQFDRQADRSKTLKRLAIGLSLVAIIAIVVETLTRVNKGGKLATLNSSSTLLIAAAAAVFLFVLVFSKRAALSKSIAAGKATKSSHV